MTNVNIRAVPYEEKSVLRNLMNLYCYDFSEMVGDDVNRHGLFEYRYLDDYWTEADRHAYFIEIEGKLGGFVMVNRLSCVIESANNIAEFFIMRKYHRHGVGERVANQIFDMFPGDWEVREMASNTRAQAFWRKVIGEYTDGQYQEILVHDERWNGPIQIFQTR